MRQKSKKEKENHNSASHCIQKVFHMTWLAFLQIKGGALIKDTWCHHHIMFQALKFGPLFYKKVKTKLLSHFMKHLFQGLNII